jgi:murein DD-endopeptidase MepM/ murein hydrolase activator NlpD
MWTNPGPVNSLEGTRILSAQRPLNAPHNLRAKRGDAAGEAVEEKYNDGLDFSEAIDIGDEKAVQNTSTSEAIDIGDEEAVQNTSTIEWLDSRGRECYRSRENKGFCQGPRRVPKPHGAEAERAVKLGLGEIETAWRLLSEAPEPSWVQAARESAAETDGRQVKLMWPVGDGKLLRGFGKVGSGRRRHLHKGLDIGADEGTRFVAVADGIVAYSDNQVRGYGNLLLVVHGDGSVAFYSHAHELYVFAGQRVRRGQPLGEVGHTGFARADHLHFEYRINGVPRNPHNKFEKTSQDEDN